MTHTRMKLRLWLATKPRTAQAHVLLTTGECRCRHVAVEGFDAAMPIDCICTVHGDTGTVFEYKLKPCTRDKSSARSRGTLAESFHQRTRCPGCDASHQPRPGKAAATEAYRYCAR